MLSAVFISISVEVFTGLSDDKINDVAEINLETMIDVIPYSKVAIP